MSSESIVDKVFGAPDPEPKRWSYFDSDAHAFGDALFTYQYNQMRNAPFDPPTDHVYEEVYALDPKQLKHGLDSLHSLTFFSELSELDPKLVSFVRISGGLAVYAEASEGVDTLLELEDYRRYLTGLFERNQDDPSAPGALSTLLEHMLVNFGTSYDALMDPDNPESMINTAYGKALDDSGDKEGHFVKRGFLTSILLKNYAFGIGEGPQPDDTERSLYQTLRTEGYLPFSVGELISLTAQEIEEVKAIRQAHAS